MLVSGCAKDGRFIAQAIAAGPCGAVDGYTLTAIAYGDSKMGVVAESRIRPNSEWRFYLRPILKSSDPDDYRNVDVAIVGKFPAANPPPNGNDWIDVNGSYATSGSNHYITECVPANAPVGKTYEYLVKIDKIGELDPRAKVY